MPRRYGVIGVGAVGGLYGARFAASGHEVHWLARSDAAHLREHGLRVDSVDGDIALTDLAVHDDPDTMPPCDVVVVAVKTTANEHLPRLLAGAARPGSTVLVLQNGLGVEERAAAAAPGTTVVGGLCFVCSHKVGPGRVHHVDYGHVTLAQLGPEGAPAGLTDELAAVAADLEAGGTRVTPEPDLGTARWKKLVWNIPFNGLSVVLDAGTDELMGDPAARSLVERLMEEVVEGGRACGAAIGADFVDKMVHYTDSMVPYDTSMRLDWRTGRRLELEAIYDEPLRRLRSAGAAAPRIEALAAELHFLDQRAAS